MFGNYCVCVRYLWWSKRFFFFSSSRRRHTRWTGDWSSDVCSSAFLSCSSIARAMHSLPCLQEFLATPARLAKQATHIRPLDPDAPKHLRLAVGPKEVDFRLPRSGDMNMRRFVIECVDHEPEAVSAVDDDHRRITYLLGYPGSTAHRRERGSLLHEANQNEPPGAGHNRARNVGAPLETPWFEAVGVNASAIERRTASLTARRSVKKEFQ